MAHRSEPLATAARSGRRLASRGAWLALVLSAAGLAFWLGGRFAAPARPSVAAAPLELEARLDALQAQLAAESAARELLSRELGELQAQLEALAPRPGAEPRLAAEEATSGSEANAREEAEPASAAEAPRAPLFDVGALVASCMRPSDAEALRARWERYELDRLRLNDSAIRESYFMRPRHRQQHAALDAAFRADVGEDGYDAYLRATGKTNRVAVRELLPTGAGSAAGIEVGDVLERYAGARVFSNTDLQLLTASGRLGEMVTLEVLRGGQPLTLRAARGPLGVVLEGVKRVPEGGC